MWVVINTGVGTRPFVASANGACACEPTATASDYRLAIWPAREREGRASGRNHTQIAALTSTAIKLLYGLNDFWNFR